MKLDRSIKLGIISSIIATGVFIYLLNPLLRLVTFILFNVFGSLARGYTDKLFEQSALLTEPDPSLMLYLGVLMMMGAAITGIVVSITRMQLREAKDEEVPKKSRLPRWLRFAVFYGSYLVVLLSILLLLYSIMFQMRIISSFNQHVVAIGPYVSDQEVKVFRSRWTQMTSERDYQELYADLRRVAAANRVRLPENKMFSFTNF